jgi:hypothetical protein
MMAAGLLLVACSSEEPDTLDLATEDPEPEETATAEPDPEPDEEPEPEDPYAVPDEIDEAYVESVINAILEVQDEVLRGALQQEQGTLLAEDLTALHFATTTGEQRQEALTRLQGYIDEPETRGNLLPPDEMGKTTFRLEELVHAEPDACLIAIGFWDNSEVSSSPRAGEEYVSFALSRVDATDEVSAGNPTPWQWRDNAAMADGDGPIPRDRWNDLDYGGALDHGCEEL